MSFFAAAMADALPALKETLGEPVAHYVPDADGNFENSEAEQLVAPFEEADSDQADQRDDTQGARQVRTGKLTLDPNVSITLGKHPSRFVIRDEAWKATAIIAGPGVQTVRLERTKSLTIRRPETQSHQ